MAPVAERQQTAETSTLSALVLILLGQHDEETTRSYVTALLGPLGIDPASSTMALALLHPHLTAPSFDVPPATASGYVNRTAVPRSAAYLLNAAQRLSQGGSLPAERHYLSQHLDAQRVREEIAVRIDAAADRWGPVLGWRSVMDSATTPQCRRAHQSNFHFARPPFGILPGTLHGGSCRCLGGPPWPGAGSVEDAWGGVLPES